MYACCMPMPSRRMSLLWHLVLLISPLTKKHQSPALLGPEIRAALAVEAACSLHVSAAGVGMLQATKEAEHRDRLDELRARIADFRHKHAAADEQNRLHKACPCTANDDPIAYAMYSGSALPLASPDCCLAHYAAVPDAWCLGQEQQEACKRELQALHNQMRAVNAMLAEIRRINSADNVLPCRSISWSQCNAGKRFMLCMHDPALVGLLLMCKHTHLASGWTSLPICMDGAPMIRFVPGQATFAAGGACGL